jgi:16S rRNA (guanine1207-N2)-methyltransferase
MANEAKRLVDLLHLPLEESGTQAARLVAFSAPANYRLPSGFTGEASIVQPFRPSFLALEASGLSVTAKPQGYGFDLALVALGRHRGQNEQILAEAASRLRDGATLIAAGFKMDGAVSLRKRLATQLAELEHASRHHGTVFWLTMDPVVRTQLRSLDVERDDRPEGFVTAPGMFSHDRIDPASRLLIEALPEKLKGAVADLGAGWGYLAVSLAQRFGETLGRVDLYEADFNALQAARANMSSVSVPAEFFWHDVRREPIRQRYDVVVMNPPFHESRAADPEIGGDFIRAAHAALKPGGRLFLVANRGLPYEAVLSKSFAAHGEIVRDGHYKVLWARR